MDQGYYYRDFDFAAEPDKFSLYPDGCSNIYRCATYLHGDRNCLGHIYLYVWFHHKHRKWLRHRFLPVDGERRNSRQRNIGIYHMDGT